MKIPEDIAGVTLVAFGSAAPELFLNMVAAAEKESDLSLPAVLGSAIIAFGLIPPLCLLCTDEKEVTLKSWPIIRETGFYVFGLATFLFSIIDGELDEIEALALVFVYVLYVSFVIGFYVYSGGGSSLPAQVSYTAEEEAIAPTSFLLGAKGSSDEFDRNTGISSSSSPSKQHNHQRSSYEAHFRDDDTNINLGLSPRANISVSPAAGAGAAAAAGTARMGDKVMSWEGEDVEEVISVQNPSWRKTAVHVWEQITAPIHSLISAVFPHLVPPTSTENEVVMNCIVAAGLASSGASTTTTEEGGARGNIAKEREDDAMFSSLSDDFSSPPPPSNSSSSHSVPLWRAVVVLAMSIASMGLLAFLIICLCQQLVVFIDVGTTTIGATLVALGSEIPDTISSIALARSGYNDGAMAGAIGSQVINISLGIGLPSLFSALANGGTQIIDPSQAKSLWLLTSLLFVIIAGYIATTLPMFRVLSCTATQYTTIRRPGAWFLLALWACVYATFIFLNESAKLQENNNTA